MGFDNKGFLLFVDVESSAAGDTALAHSPGHHGRVGCHATSGGENSLGGIHAPNILRGGLRPNQNHLFAMRCGVFGIRCGKHDLSHSGAGGGRESLGNDVNGCLGINGRVKKLVNLIGVDSHDRGLFVDQFFLNQLNGDFDGCRRRSFSNPGLEHV